MTDTPTREQVSRAIVAIAAAQYDGKEPEGWQVTVVCEAADAWLEGPKVTEERIERAAEELDRVIGEAYDEELGIGLSLTKGAERILRVAWEDPDDV